MGTTTHQPHAKYRVLATFWEAEMYVECWTESRESAECIASALKRGDVSVQIDRVTPEGHSVPQSSEVLPRP